MDDLLHTNLLKSNYAKLPDGIYSGVIRDIKMDCSNMNNPLVIFYIESINNDKEESFSIRSMYSFSSKYISESIKSINEVSKDYGINLFDVIENHDSVEESLKPMIGNNTCYKVYHKEKNGSLYKDVILINTRHGSL